MDAQRGEVFSSLYRGGERLEGPSAERPAVTLVRWAAMVGDAHIRWAGDGAVAYAGDIARTFPRAEILGDGAPLAPAIAAIAVEAAARHEAVPPDAVRPIYVRRSDVELARDRAAAGTAGKTP